MALLGLVAAVVQADYRKVTSTAVTAGGKVVGVEWQPWEVQIVA